MAGLSAGMATDATTLNPAVPRCLNSGRPTRYGNTFATVADAREYQDRVAEEVAELVALGFEQDPTTPNLFRKDGLGITLESYRRNKDGILGAHAALVERARRGDEGACSGE